ncbi:DUF4190 domain-containing protein [Mycetocola sp. 2940]|uniref:DUF4190 domain-containing protein n=1 Tax=Mycetocola sp. 2940 TaxID=3156452 RepID=UPI00339777C3
MTNSPESPSGPAGPQPQQPQVTHPTQPYPPHQQSTYNLNQFHPQAQQPPAGYPLAGQPPAKHGNGPGLAALILGIIAIVAAVIPIVNFLAFPLGTCGLILGIVGLVLVDRPRVMAIWGTVLSVVSLILAFVMVFVYTFGLIFAISEGVDESTQNRPVPTEVTDPPPTSAPFNEVHPLNTSVELTDDSGDAIYRVTLSASILDATDEVAAIPANPEAPAGMQWAMATLDLTTLSDATVFPALDVTVQYVASDAQSYSPLDAPALAPESALIFKLRMEPGERSTGNVVIAIPSDDPAAGMWAVRYGGPSDGGDWYYFAVE